ncbi:MAG TPA: FAD binding domain-containing protein [Pyrinomonadaceae bacterium]|nr:FAD binding domain-containing protein [Pyrinomonadaceae bacterium]
MIKFILNNEAADTDQPAGITVLDFVRYHKDLKGTKIGCREGDCGACTILVGELKDGGVRYRTMTSCLMPLANAAGKHIVTIEGINPADGSLTPVQQAMVDESGTQCGFCTVGFVMSLTGYCLTERGRPRPHVRDDELESAHGTLTKAEAAISSIDGNICRCTGYKSIERAAERLCSGSGVSSTPSKVGVDDAFGERDGSLRAAIDRLIVPAYFADISSRLRAIETHSEEGQSGRPLSHAVPTFVGGGTDVYVQRPEAMAEGEASHVFYDESLRGIRDLGNIIEIGASATVTDLLESSVMNEAFPNLYKHLKLVSSTPIRNMATLAGNFVNASPIGDMTIWFLALNSEITIGTRTPASAAPQDSETTRTIPLRRLFTGYKQLEISPDEYITAIRFKKPTADHYFNFEKVCKRTYLDIATVNTAISLKCESLPGKNWTPPALSGAETGSPPYEEGVDAVPSNGGRGGSPARDVEYLILDAHVSAGGVAPIPLYLKETSSFLVGRTVNTETIEKANEIMQLEISPISDVRGTEEYKRLLLRQLFHAHFFELFGT